MKIRLSVLGATLLLMVGFSWAALAQDVGPEIEAMRANMKEAEDSRRDFAMTDPSLTSTVQESTPAIALLATEDGGKVSAQAGWKVQGWDLLVRLEAPLDESSGGATLANLDGLVGDTVGTLQVTREWIGSSWIQDKERGSLKGGSRLLKVCQDFERSKKPSVEFNPAVDCRYSFLKKQGERWKIRAWNNMPVALYYASAAFSASESKFGFVDPDDLSEKETTETNRSFDLSASMYRSGWLLTAGVTHREVYSASRATELCRPLGDTDALTCQEVNLGAPAMIEQDIARLEAKWQRHPNYAWTLRFLYDWEEDLFNPHLLLYVLPEDDGALRGGFDFSWSEDDDFTARVFIGRKFGLSPG